MDQQQPKTQTKMATTRKYKETGLPEWLLEFRHGLVDESVPEHRDASSSSHELPSDPRAEVVCSKHSMFYSLPEGPKLRYLPEKQIDKDFLHMTCWYSRAKSGKIWCFNNCGSQSSQ